MSSLSEETCGAMASGLCWRPAATEASDRRPHFFPQAGETVVSPTITRLMGFKLDGVDGRVLNEILKD